MGKLGGQIGGVYLCEKTSWLYLVTVNSRETLNHAIELQRATHGKKFQFLFIKQIKEGERPKSSSIAIIHAFRMEIRTGIIIECFLNKCQ